MQIWACTPVSRGRAFADSRLHMTWPSRETIISHQVRARKLGTTYNDFIVGGIHARWDLQLHIRLIGGIVLIWLRHTCDSLGEYRLKRRALMSQPFPLDPFFSGNYAPVSFEAERV
jgi:hypothetical protein